MWTARALCELQLIGSDLMRTMAPLPDSPPCKEADACGAPASWLLSSLHYTGLGQDRCVCM